MRAQQIVDALDLALEEGDMEAAEELRNMLQQTQGPSIADEQVGPGRALAAGVAQGGTFGRGDEIQGRIGAAADTVYGGLRGIGIPDPIARPLGAVGGFAISPYFDFGQAEDQLTGDARQELSLGRQQHPGLAYGGEIGTAMATGGAGMRALGGVAPLANLSTWQRRFAYPGIAGVEGALYGSGAAEEGDRLRGGAVGGALGVGAGVALPAVVGAAGWTSRKVMDAFRAGDPARQRAAEAAIREVAEAEGVDPMEVLRWLSSNKDLSLADYSPRYLGRSTQSMQGATAGGRDEVVSSMQGRLNRQSGALEDTAERVTGTQGQSYRQTVEELAQRRQDMSMNEYAKLFAEAPGINLSPQERAVLNRPSVLKAWNGAERLARDFGQTIQGNASRLHWTKVKLGVMIEDAKKAEKAALSESRKAIQETLEREIPDYARLTSEYGDTFAIEKAADAGRNLFRGAKPFEDLEDLGQLTGDRAEAFAIGLKDGLRQRIRDWGDRDPRNLFTQPQRDRIRTVMGEEADDLFAAVEREARGWRTSDALIKAKAQLETAPDVMGGGAIAALGLQRKIMFLSQIFNGLTKKADHLTPREHDRILEMLTRPIRSQRQIDEIERALTPIYDKYYGTAGVAGMIGGAPGVLASE